MKFSTGKVKGRLSYKGSINDLKKGKKKKKTKEIIEELSKDFEKKSKKFIKKAQKKSVCNHIDRNTGKKLLKAYEVDGVIDPSWKVCKICGERVHVSKLDEQEYKDARDTMLSLVSAKMMKFDMSDKEYADCVNLKVAVKRAYHMIDEFDTYEQIHSLLKNDKKKGKGKGKKKKNKVNHSRINFR